MDSVEDIYKLLFRSDEVGTHGYPNDYWRFTPEALRALAAEFPLLAIFSVAHASFRSAASQQRTNMMSRQSKAHSLRCDIKTTAPLMIEGPEGANHPPLMAKLVMAKEHSAGRNPRRFRQTLAAGLGSGHASMDCRLGRAGECA